MSHAKDGLSHLKPNHNTEQHHQTEHRTQTSAELFLILPVNWAFRKLWENVISIFLDAKSRSATKLLKVSAAGWCVVFRYRNVGLRWRRLP